MKCMIECSIGEVIDKYTILKIKKTKATNNTQLSNINLELTKIEENVDLCKQDDDLFKQLLIINKKLWLMEDIIREKSAKKEYDKQFIHTAEQIHIVNDQRYIVKKNINIKYNSEIVEEKIYKNHKIDNEDIEKLNKINKLYSIVKYNESYLQIKPLVEKYKTYCIRNPFINRLFIDYNTIISTIYEENLYFYKTLEIIDNIDMYEKSIKENFIRSLNIYCLSKNKLDLLYAYNFLNYTNHIFGPNIYPDTADFIKEGDVNKNVLLYIGGGYGDKIMFIRFIPLICEKYKQHTFILLIEDRIVWMLKKAFQSITNLSILEFSKKSVIPLLKYDYHHNVTNIMKFLDIRDLNQVPYVPYLKNISFENNIPIIANILQSSKKKYIINWHGNFNSGDEKYTCRDIPLYKFEELFKKQNIIFIIVTQEISNKEMKILRKYKNVKNISKIVDKENGFEDTMYLLKHADGLITTDTALAHLSGTMDIKTYVLLNKYCEWRWGTATKTAWYPNLTLIRQQDTENWDNVMNELNLII
jgi:ADP-heptose:LPS heptosyltransferase